MTQTRNPRDIPATRHQAPIRPTRNRKWLPYAIIGGMLALGAAMFAAVIAVLGIMALSQDRIPAGVSVAGLDLGGKTTENAATLIEQNLSNAIITAVDEERTWPISLRELGVRLDSDLTLAAAQDSTPNAAIQPTYQIDLATAQNGLIALSDQTNIAAVPGQMGRSIDIPLMLDRLRKDLTGELGDGTLDLSMIVVEPEVTTPEQAAFTGETTTHVIQSGEELTLIARQYGVNVQDIISLNAITNPDIIWVGEELLIPAAGVYEPTAADAPPAPANIGKSIVVSTEMQRIYAYENGQFVRSYLTSTGLPETPTVKGDYSIYVKYVADDMSGADYFLPQVPYVMYFFQGYGIHGTYWHNKFGRPMSHGCVNLPVDQAEWIFNWAEVGTPVRVI